MIGYLVAFLVGVYAGMTLLAIFATSKQAESRVLPFRKPRRRSA